MRKVILASALCTSIYAADDYWCLNNVVTLQAEYAYLRRTEIRDLCLVEEATGFVPLGNDDKLKKVMDTDSLVDRLGFQSGIRVGATFHFGPCSSIEAQYTYVYSWKGKKTVEAAGELQFPFEDLTVVNDYVQADKAEGLYRSRLQNGELNYWGHITPQRVDYFSFSWNLGFRLILLKEKMELLFTKEDNTSPYRIDTRDNLYGAQLGAKLEMNPTSCWTWTFMLKGAMFLNRATNDVLVLDNNATTIFLDYDIKKYTDSYLLEGYGQLAYHPTSSLSIHFGYQGYILTGIALAPNQRDVSVVSNPHINRKGQIVIDGLYAGVDIGF